MSLARLVPLLLTVALTGCGSDAVVTSAPLPAKPEPAATATAPAPAAPTPEPVPIPEGPGQLQVMAPPEGLVVRDEPDGRVIAHLRPKTEWGSPTVVWAPERRGPWLGILATALGNGTVGWIDARRDEPRMWRSRMSLEADLSERTLVLRRGGQVARRMTVTIGGPSSPTPTGRFSVTDKLMPDAEHSYYGCCLLALSGHQPNLRPGWAGGDRIAIHGGPGDVGIAASAGCLRASDGDLRALMRVVPVGTPVVIRG